MKRFFLTAATMFALLHANAQIVTDSTSFKSRKLKVEEINFISSYYYQNGDNAAVTGGVGSQKLTDLSNIVDIKLTRYDKKYRKHSFSAEMGIDHYSSASSDMVDFKANSSASYTDTRFYPSVNWTIENEKKGTTFGLGASASKEFDYLSYGGSINLSKKTNNKSGEFTAKFQTFLDQVSLIAPVELRTAVNTRERTYPTTSRNTFTGSLSYAQIINQRLQIIFLADVVQQQGFLSLPFHRVYFKDASVHQENLPNNRFKIPLGFRANYFLGDQFIIKTYYRFYKDDWGLTSHTANIEVPVKLTPFVSISPYFRFYTQSAIKYFAPYQTHTVQNQYYTSNFDNSKFSSNFFGAGIRLAPPKGIFGIKDFSMIEFRYGHYTRTTGLNADILSINLKFK